MACAEQVAINKAAGKTLGISIEEIDAVKSPDAIRRYRLKVTPTIVILGDGEVKEKFEGVVHEEQLVDAVRKYL